MKLSKTRSRWFFLALAAGVSAAVYVMAPKTIPELGRRSLAIFAAAAILWATEALPLYATSLCVVGLEILVLAEKGGWAGEGGLSHVDFLMPFSSSVIILFMGGFLLSKAVTKHGVDQVLSAYLLKPFGRRPLLLIFGVMGATGFFSMWMSNTATAAMMLALLHPILKVLPEQSRFRAAVVLAVPFGANIGGIGTPIGTPPNAVCLAALRNAGIEIGFARWMAATLPLVVLMMAGTGVLLYMLFRPEKSFVWKPVSLPPAHLGKEGWQVCGVLLGTATLWLTGGWHGLNEAVVALVAAAVLTAMRLLGEDDVDSIDWNILILMWGGLALGNAMSLTGVTLWLGSLPLENLSVLVLFVVVALFAVSLSTFMSNTAAANLMIPMVMSLGGAFGAPLAMLTALASSFAMALPISTPPNAMAFASGAISAKDMVRSGVLVSVAGTTLLLLGSHFILPWVLSR